MDEFDIDFLVNNILECVMITWKMINIAPHCEVSSDGQVRILETGKLLPLSEFNGYKIVSIPKVNHAQFVHRLVAFAFLGNPPTLKHQVAHTNGMSNDNCVENLRWATPRENHLDKALHGTMARGVTHWNNIFTEDDIHEIDKLCSEGVQGAEIAKSFNTDPSVISNVIHRKSWAHIPKRVQTTVVKPTKLKEEDIPKIDQLLKAGHSQAVIAEIFSVSFQLISQVKHRKIWKHIPKQSDIPHV